MRAYFFTNFYLSPIQKGIQSQHCTADMFVKYHNDQWKDTAQEHILFEWAQNHKTSIILNGGNHSDLGYIHEVIDLGWKSEHSNHCYPYERFMEDEVSLNRANTCVGIILPELIYKTAELFRTTDRIVLSARLNHEIGLRGTAVPDWGNPRDYISKWELMFIEKFLSVLPLAN